MDWNKQNLKEIAYYCTSYDIDFDCLPLRNQIEAILSIFFYYGATTFEAEDIKEFYRIIQIPSPRSDRVRNPSLTQVQRQLAKLKNIRPVNENTYEILCADTEIYKMQIEQGYAKNRII